MAWGLEYDIVGGLLNGEQFSSNIGAMSEATFDAEPSPSSNVFYGVNGYGMYFTGVTCMSTLKTLEVGVDTLLWALDVAQTTYLHVSILMFARALNSTGTFEFRLVKRVYTDETTYTDTNITNSTTLAIAFYFENQYANTERIDAFFGQSHYSGTNYFFVGFSWHNTEYPDVPVDRFAGYTLPLSKIEELIGGDIPSEEFSPEYGDAGDADGGYNEDGEHGTFDDSSDEITIPNMPTISPLSAGYFHAYYLADPETRLAWIGDALFPQDPLTQPDILSALGEVAQMLYFNKQIDYVVDCHVIPCIPSYGANVPIKVGGRELKTSQGGTEYTIQAPQITNGYVDYNCGEIEIKEYWRNFLDFSCGTRCKIFLPFVGYVDILPEFFNGGKLGIKYRFNVVDGTFMCFVTSTSSKSKLKNSMIAQYSGCACMHIPLQSADYSRIIGGVVSTLTSVAGVASGNVAVAGAGLVGSLPNLVGQKPNVSSSNGYTASGSYMSKRTPYLIIERAKSQFSKNYPNEIGLPLNITRSLATIHGLTIIENPVLNIDCSDEEYNEIVSLLKSGVIF